MEAKLRQELMIKDLEDRVVALMVVVTAAAAPASARRLLVDEEDEITSKVPPKVLSISLHFTDLFQEEIIRIFHKKFKPINFYCLRHIRGL